AHGVADFFARHAWAFQLRPHVLLGPEAGVRPVDLAALGVELAAVLRHQAEADQVEAVGALDELGFDPVFHGVVLAPRRAPLAFWFADPITPTAPAPRHTS